MGVVVEVLLEKMVPMKVRKLALTMGVVVEVLLENMVPMKVRKLVLHCQEFPTLSELDEDHPVTNELVPASG